MNESVEQGRVGVFVGDTLRAGHLAAKLDIPGADGGSDAHDFADAGIQHIADVAIAKDGLQCPSLTLEVSV